MLRCRSPHRPLLVGTAPHDGASARGTTSFCAPSYFSHALPPTSTVSPRALVCPHFVLQVAQYVTERAFGSPWSWSALPALDPSSQERRPGIWLVGFNKVALGSCFGNLSGRKNKKWAILKYRPVLVSYFKYQTSGRSHLQGCALLLSSPCRCSGLRART
jgi:hypothetical protein